MLVNTFTPKSTFKQTLIRALKLSYPIVIAQLGVVAMGVADTIMVGRLGATELAGASLGNSLYFLLACLGIGLTSVISPLVAQAKGQDDKTTTQELLTAGFRASVVLSLVITCLVVLLGLFIYQIGQEIEVATITETYLYTLASSTLPLVLFLLGRNFTDGLSYTKIAMVITFLGVLFNVFFNWLFIFGVWGFPRWELFGAGVATSLTRVAMAVAIFWYIFANKQTKKYASQFSFWKVNQKLLCKIYTMGIPSGLQYFFEIGCFSIAALMIGWLGKYPLAAHQVVLSLASVTYMVATGIGAAGAILVGENFGQKNKDEIKTSSLVILFLATIFMLWAALSFILFQNFFIGLYSTDYKVFTIATGLLLIACLFQLSDGIQCVGLHILKGIEDVKIPTIFTLIAYWVIGLPFGYLLGFTFKMGVYGVWFGLCLGLTSSALLLNIRFFYLLKVIKFEKK
jgi:MATE family multidrug resistance protein